MLEFVFLFGCKCVCARVNCGQRPWEVQLLQPRPVWEENYSQTQLLFFYKLAKAACYVPGFPSFLIPHMLSLRAACETFRWTGLPLVLFLTLVHSPTSQSAGARTENVFVLNQNEVLDLDDLSLRYIMVTISERCRRTKAQKTVSITKTLG